MAKILDGDKAGIYRIRITRGDKLPWSYIGQASVLRKRRDKHFRALRRGEHVNERMQRAFNKYGEESFSFEVIGLCAREKAALDHLERLWLANELLNAPPGTVLNICIECPGSKLGVPMKQETKDKIGAGNRGKTRSAEHRKAVGDATRVRNVSEATRAKRSASLMGNKNSLGHKQTDEHKAKVGAAFRGKNRPPGVIEAMQAGRKAWLERKRNGGPKDNGESEGRN